MRKFAFICHPLDFDQLASVDPGLAKKSPRLVRQVMAQVPPSHVRTIHIQSATGEEVICELICIWLLPDQFKNLEPKLVETKLFEAMQIVAKLNCELVGLGAYTKVAALGDPQLYKGLPFAITTGNTFTAALAVQALETLLQTHGMSRDATEFAVVGAKGAIGNAVLRSLAPQVAKVNLVGRNMAALEKAAHETKSYGCEVEVYADAKSACREADLIFLATSEPGLLIQATDLAWKACVVDVSKPVNILSDPTRTDVTIMDCAMVETPKRQVLHNWVKCFPHVVGLDSPEIFACFAESMILALEGRMEAYSQGRNLEIHKFSEILTLANKHGFGNRISRGPWKVESSEAFANSMLQLGMAW